MSGPTIQEVCDYAVSKIVEQGGQCKRRGNCAYVEGYKRCVAGHAYEMLDPKFLLKIANHLGVVGKVHMDHPFTAPRLMLKNERLMRCLQEFHDANSIFHRKQILEEIKNNFGIDTSAPHWQQWVEMGKFIQGDRS